MVAARFAAVGWCRRGRVTACADHRSTQAVDLDRDALDACRAPHSPDGPGSGYVVLRLSGQRRIEIDHALAGLDYAGLLCQLPERHCRWALYVLPVFGVRCVARSLEIWFHGGGGSAGWTRSKSMPTARQPQSLPLPSPVGALTFGQRSQISMIAVSILNDRARLSARRSFITMGWPPGHPIAYQIHSYVITIRSTYAGTSRYKIGAPGHIRLPAQILRASGIRPGDTVLILAMPAEGVLAIVPAPLVEDALSAIVADLVGPA
ncbi:AbrB/MazE/SpoVT family DNA-binding domain-containing protein [Nocardia takedensis]|uniref:AbrB/MazE/SpoVT family DNA-binding domain-containing protein n=1 Tax=Nocardia takedensis TaxID=259390 RepID=UPI003F769610